MAFNWPTFRTRALTAIVFAAVMLAGLLWNWWSFLILFSVIHFGCWIEYLRLQEKIHRVELNTNLKLGWMILGYGIMLYVPALSKLIFENTTYALFIGGRKLDINFILIAAGTLLTLAGTVQQKIITLKSFGAAALGLLYISLSWGWMLDLYASFDIDRPGKVVSIGAGILPIVLIASIWINDTMAYIVGSFIGKTPLSPISPKKTWEGTIGGILLCTLVVGLLAPLIIQGEITMPLTGWLAIIAAIAGITGTIGDLLESKLKRMAGVKDSGNIMPGHGGFMDRFDSLLVATPFAWIIVRFILY